MFKPFFGNKKGISYRINEQPEASVKFRWGEHISEGLIVVNSRREVIFINKVIKNWFGNTTDTTSIDIPPLTEGKELAEFHIGNTTKLVRVTSTTDEKNILLFIHDHTAIQQHAKASLLQGFFDRIIHNLPYGLLQVNYHSPQDIEFVTANENFFSDTQSTPPDQKNLSAFLNEINPEIVNFINSINNEARENPSETFEIKNEQTIKLIGIPDGKNHVVLLTENITEQLETEREQQKNQQRLLFAQRATSDALADFDFEHNDLYLSSRFYSMLGYQENVFEPTVENWYRLVHPEDQRAIVQPVRDEVLKNNDFFRAEFRMRTNTGQWRWILLRGQVVKRNKKSIPSRIVATHQDITSHKEQTYLLKEQENKLKRFINNLDGMVYRCKFDALWTMQFISDGASKLTGYTPKELLQNQSVAYNDIIDARDQEKVREVIEKSAEEKSVFDLTYRIKTKNGNLKWVHERGSFVSINGREPHVEGVILDITAEKEAEMALNSSEKKFRTYISHAPDGILVLNKELQIVEFNKAALHLLEYPEEELPNLLFKDLVHADLQEMRTFFRSLHELGNASSEIRLKTKKNKLFHAMISGVRLPNKVNLIFVKDINDRKNAELELQQKNIAYKELNNNYLDQNKTLTEVNAAFKQMNNELRIAKNKAEESEQLKSAFLANMSHEIRTPMNGILGFSRLLVNQNLTQTKRERYIRVIDKSGEQLLALINNILDISKIETDQVKLNFELINLHDFFHEVFARFSHDASSNGLDLLIDLPKQSHTINTDPMRLAQVFTNLITNALKFTEKGYIKIGYTVTGNKIECFVEDTGMGIPPDQLEKIFERFQQAHTNLQHIRGTGLGLAISKGLVNMLGGQISANSTTDVGSVFTFTLPA
ncbi:MAG: PAS domain-containing protein [Salinivirgaceae bacterium]